MSKIELIDWRTIDYKDAWDRQEQLFQSQIDRKSRGEKTENTLIFCFHPNVYTIGKSGKEQNMLLDDGSVPIYRTNRGGDITYHGYGQIVGYPIFDLESLGIGLKEYIFRIESSIINVLAGYGIKAEHYPEGTGVWIDTDNPQKARKICAIGVRSSRFITMHGFALNVNTDLSYFQRINPCGFTDRGVTSMRRELEREVDIEEVKNNLYNEILRQFL